jgi:hypothetical protein
MKKYRKEGPFLEQLKNIPNISLACEKVGISRNTVYRWCNEDPEFKKRIEEATEDGIDSINDLAESKLISSINNGSLRAIEYWLTNNKKAYIKPRPKDFWEIFKEPNPIAQIVISPATPVQKKKAKK